jgi:hypothetical protein
VRVQDTEIYQADDPTVLARTAQKNHTLLTDNISTIPCYAYERVGADKRVPGVIAAHRNAAIGRVIEDLPVIIGASDPAEYGNQVVHLP